jgi:threonine/homoserine/homoserine lactone efflux protein
MSGAFTSGVAAGYGIAIPLGAIAMLIVITASRDSFRHGFTAGLGAASADLVYASIAVAAGSAFGQRLHGVATPMHVVAGCALAAIALRGVIGAVRARPSRSAALLDPLGATYLRFFALTLVNPLTIVYFASVVLGSQTAATPARAAAFVVGVALASATWQIMLATSGALAGRVLIDRGRLATGVVGYGIVLALALHQFQEI